MAASSSSPVEPFEAVRRYREHTNVLETTFATASGSVRVTDAMLLGSDQRELIRVVDPREGRVRDALALPAADGGAPRRAGTPATASSSSARARAPRSSSPRLAPTREDAERRLERTAASWMDWAARAEYDGRWREPVLRSALTLKLLTYDPTGAIVAAPTTSLPERIGGDRNWDYRFSWLRDGIYTMRALLSLGYRDEAEAFFRWQLEAIEPDLPEVKPLYRIDGSSDAREQELDLPGYRGSRPVRDGNAATSQLQLDVYGHLLESAARLRGETGVARPRAPAARSRQLGRLRRATPGGARTPGSGRCATASPTSSSRRRCAGRRSTAPPSSPRRERSPAAARRWREEAEAVRAWIESEGWSEELGSYVRAPELGDEVDASLLSLPLCAYSRAADPRFLATADTIRRELGAGGPLLYRTQAARESEGAFLTCSFWLVDALGRAGRTEEGHELMAELIALANDVGLYGEEIDPATGEHLGNFPQGLVHLALVNAAVSLEEPD